MYKDDYRLRESSFTFLRRRRTPGLAVAAGAVIVVVLLGAGMGWFWFRSRLAPAEPLTGAPAAAATVPSAATPDVPPLNLPSLDVSDEFVRDLVARLSAHPQLAAWLVNDALARRFVTAVISLAEGMSPAPHVPFLEPAEPFEVENSGERLFIDPASYRRYDLLAETFASLDTDGTARLYRQLLPLFDDAYRELGLHGRSFDEATARAIANLLAVDVPDGRLEVIPSPAVATVHEFAEAGLEARSPAEKHLLRMGPDNARRVQAKLAEIGSALGMHRPADAHE